ncbi:MAG: CoB--CoM heterodisulfide reductase iron-sulfur subunit B family protein [Anaerolineales bacterium]|nr:CoB--CoM heterodisulfide reductase iron-sulfur subunit B family protein [Anaerolineales bacterium]
MSRTYAYFPGCTLRSHAQDYESQARAAGQALGIDLVELPEWNCCGATFPLNAENVMDLVAPARVLIAAGKAGGDLVTLCAVCFHVLRRSANFLSTHPFALERLNAFVVEGPVDEQVRPRHYLEVLRDDLGWEAVQARVTQPQTGLRLAAYYGCMLLRPGPEIGLDDPERPSILENLVEAVGGEPMPFSHAAECCGSYLAVTQPAAVDRASAQVVQSARAAGAAAVITACPLCKYNLEQAQRDQVQEDRLPIAYFTQLLTLALGLDAPESAPWSVAAPA